MRSLSEVLNFSAKAKDRIEDQVISIAVDESSYAKSAEAGHIIVADPAQGSFANSAVKGGVTESAMRRGIAKSAMGRSEYRSRSTGGTTPCTPSGTRSMP